MAKLAKMSITRYALIGLAVLVVAGTAGLTTYFGFRKPHIQAVQPPAIQRVERKVEDKSPRIWCFRHKPAPEGILLYGLGIEDNGKLSKPFLLDAKKALDNSKPLAFACTEDGNIWWVSPDAIYSAKIAAKSGCCKLEQVRKLTHVEQPEYAVRGAAVVAASILMLDGQDLPYVATVDRTGWLKIFRPPLDGNQIKDFSLLHWHKCIGFEKGS
ncbi:hypothetical protein HYT84_00865 [Candidatus Micrarchaeota archaeon]|nr:hypothetical protein [Candidatus Micrarchaeota archaeon]